MRLSRAQIRERLAAVRPTLGDRIVSQFDPVRGLRRFRARQAMALAGGYTGARKDRRQTSGWSRPETSADSALLWDLPTLRDSSNDLLRNNALAVGAINTSVTNVVGTGLRLQAQIDRDLLGLDDTAAAEWQAQTEREFRLWATSTDCDQGRTDDFCGLQALAFRSVLENGDAFALLPHLSDRPGPYRLAVQLIEGHRVDSPLGSDARRTLAGGNVLSAGVESRNGVPVAYYIRKTHPGDLGGAADFHPVPAFGPSSGRRNVLHLYKRLRIGQSRGVPYLAPVIESLKQLGDYTEAEITSAVVSGLFSVFVKTPSGEGLDVADLAGETGGKTSDKDVKLGSGNIIDLADGEEVSFADPGRPNTAFEPFVLAVLRQIGAALEIPHEILIKHFTASFSASRAALLEAWRHFRVRRAWLAAHFCQPVYEAWLEDAILLGRITAPGFFDDAGLRAAWCGARWGGDGPGHIDEVKAVTAAVARMDANLTSLHEEKTALDGGDWEQTLKQRARERGLIGEHSPAPAAPAAPDDDPEQGDDRT